MDGPAISGLRADALRNRERLVQAAQIVVGRYGPDVALDGVAEEAGVGIATLYRRFPSRGALFTAVTRHALSETARVAHEVAERDDLDGLGRIGLYLERMVDSHAAVVIPMLYEREDVDAEAFQEVQDEAAAAVTELASQAHADGSLPPAITSGDIGTILVRLARPLPGGLSPELDRELARRHIRWILAGLRHPAAATISAGPEFADLAQV